MGFLFLDVGMGVGYDEGAARRGRYAPCPASMDGHTYIHTYMRMRVCLSLSSVPGDDEAPRQAANPLQRPKQQKTAPPRAPGGDADGDWDRRRGPHHVRGDIMMRLYLYISVYIPQNAIVSAA